MHSALYIIEVLTAILERCDRRSLSKCTAVSKTWSEISKRLLWVTCTIENMGNLLDILGWRGPLGNQANSSSPTATPDEFSEYIPGVITLKRRRDESVRFSRGSIKPNDTFLLPTIEQWDRFYRYSSMILEVNVDWAGSHSDFEEGSYHLALASARHPIHGYLFPKLQSLSVFVSHPPKLLASMVFLQPELQAITVNINNQSGHWENSDGTEGIASFIGAAAFRCPDLLHLAVTGDSPGSWHCTSSRFSSLIGQMTLLITLELVNARLQKDDLFALLSDLPWLESIDIRGGVSNGWLEKAVEEEALFEGAFPSLRSFQGDLSFDLLAILIHPYFPLRSLELLTMEGCEMGLTEELTKTIGGLPLVELKLKMGPEQFRINDLLPLSTLTNLRVLEITSQIHFTITDDELYPLIGSWAKLETIRLSNSSSTTLRSVRSLLEHCPVILVIQINVDASELPEMTEDNSANTEEKEPNRNCRSHILPPVELEGKEWKVTTRDPVEGWIYLVGKQAGRTINMRWI